MDHAPVVAPPPTLAPVNEIADGDDDWQTTSGPPATTVAAWFTVIVLVALTGGQGPAPSGSALVNVRVTVPKDPAVGVNVTVAGLVVGFVLLNVPVPEVIDHVPVVVPP